MRIRFSTKTFALHAIRIYEKEGVSTQIYSSIDRSYYPKIGFYFEKRTTSSHISRELLCLYQPSEHTQEISIGLLKGFGRAINLTLHHKLLILVTVNEGDA